MSERNWTPAKREKWNSVWHQAMRGADRDTLLEHVFSGMDERGELCSVILAKDAEIERLRADLLFLAERGRELEAAINEEEAVPTGVLRTCDGHLAPALARAEATITGYHMDP